jgi:hypothetical protein
MQPAVILDTALVSVLGQVTYFKCLLVQEQLALGCGTLHEHVVEGIFYL